MDLLDLAGATRLVRVLLEFAIRSLDLFDPELFVILAVLFDLDSTLEFLLVVPKVVFLELRVDRVALSLDLLELRPVMAVFLLLFELRVALLRRVDEVAVRFTVVLPLEIAALSLRPRLFIAIARPRESLRPLSKLLNRTRSLGL